jgi:hypothetical protein
VDNEVSFAQAAQHQRSDTGQPAGNQLFISLEPYNKSFSTSRSSPSRIQIVWHTACAPAVIQCPLILRGVLYSNHNVHFPMPLSELSSRLCPCGLSHSCPLMLRDRVALCGVGGCSRGTCTMGIRWVFETARQPLSRSESTTLMRRLPQYA